MSSPDVLNFFDFDRFALPGIPSYVTVCVQARILMRICNVNFSRACRQPRHFAGFYTGIRPEGKQLNVYRTGQSGGRVYHPPNELTSCPLH